MQFNDLLEQEKIEPEGVMLLRHRPVEPELRKVLPWLASESHDVFNAYQQTQGPIVEKAMPNAKFVAAFIGHEPGKALFVGLYKMAGTRLLSFQQFWNIRAKVELKTFGIQGMSTDSPKKLWFDLVPMNFRSEWKGKLVVQWPGKEVSWWRWAERKRTPNHSILEDSILGRDMPEWTQISIGLEAAKCIAAEVARHAFTMEGGIFYSRCDGRQGLCRCGLW